MAELDLETIKTGIDKAHELVGELASGKQRWTMHIPVDMQRDSDMILSSALSDAEKLLEEVRDLRALFDLQWKRTREADELWRREDPVARANVHPDLGDLLAWLMAQIGHARSGGFAEAVAMLRDDARCERWWTSLPSDHPAYGYWQNPARRHMADYLETIARPLPGSPCCDSHNTNCEPPSELCCAHCGEVRHPEHQPGVVCVLDATKESGS